MTSWRVMVVGLVVLGLTSCTGGGSDDGRSTTRPEGSERTQATDRITVTSADATTTTAAVTTAVPTTTTTTGSEEASADVPAWAEEWMTKIGRYYTPTILSPVGFDADPTTMACDTALIDFHTEASSLSDPEGTQELRAKAGWVDDYGSAQSGQTRSRSVIFTIEGMPKPDPAVESDPEALVRHALSSGSLTVEAWLSEGSNARPGAAAGDLAFVQLPPDVAPPQFVEISAEDLKASDLDHPAMLTASEGMDRLDELLVPWFESIDECEGLMSN